MSNVAALGIQVNFSSAQEAAAALKRLTDTGRQAEQSIGGIGSRTTQANASLARLAASTRTASLAAVGLSSAFTAVGAGVIAKQAVEAADAYKSMTARLSLVTDGAGQLAQVQEQLYDVAQRTRAPLGETTDLYTKMARATKDLGVDQAQLISVTETINKAMAVSGGSMASNAAALQQLGQAFNAGVLRGEEFNSVMEQAPKIIDLIAKGMGKTTGEMRAMAEAGQLTSNRVFPALLSGAKSVGEEFDKMPKTVAGSFQVLGNAVTRLIADVDKATGATDLLSQAILRLAETTDRIRALQGRKFMTDDVAKIGAELRTLQAGADTAVRGMEKLNAEKNKGNPAAVAAFNELANALKVNQDRAAGLREQLRMINGEGAAAANGAVKQLGDGLRSLRGLDNSTIDNSGMAMASTEAQKTWDEYVKRSRSAAQIKKDTIAEIRYVGQLQNYSEKEINDLIASETARLGKGEASKAANDAEAAAKRIAALNEKFGKKDLTTDLADINRAMKTHVEEYSLMTDRLETERDAGKIGEEEYYRDRVRIIELSADRQIAALRETNQRLIEEEQIGRERIAEASKGKGGKAAGAEEQQKFDTDQKERLRQRADNEAEMLSIGRRSASQTYTLLSQQDTAARRLEDSYAVARVSAQEYFHELQKGQDVQLASIELGEREERRLAGRDQIQERYASQRADVQRALMMGVTETQRAELNNQLKLIDEYQGKALQSYDQYWARLMAKEADGVAGAKRAIADYIASSENIAGQTNRIMTSALGGLEDAFVRFAQTGKLSFKDLADTMIAELTRALVHQSVGKFLSMMTGAAGGAMGGTSRLGGSFTVGGAGFGSQNDFFANGGVFDGGLKKFAGGGIVTSPTLFRFANGAGMSRGLMGEAGPEAIIPLKRGKDGKLGVGGGGENITVHNSLTIQSSDNQPSPREMQRIMAASVRDGLMRARKRNGPI